MNKKLIKSVLSIMLVILGISNELYAQTMVKDIRSGGGSKPNRFISMGTTLFFVADISTTGNNPQLWKTDGSAVGTSMVSDKILASSGRILGMASLGGYLYFVAFDSNLGFELYKTDGTMAGTVLVKDIYPGTLSSMPSDLVVYNGKLYFYADDGTNGFELWKSDGTTGGTVMVKDIRPGQYGSIATEYATELINMNNMLYFVAWDGVHQGHQLWKTDGTASGTVRVKSDNTIKYPQQLFAYNGKLYFSADDSGVLGRELYKSDGTDVGTILVKNIHVANYMDSAPGKFTVANNTLFFAANDDNSGRELWKTDGTASGTVKVKEIYPGSTNGLMFPNTYLTKCNNNLFFPANDGVNGTELWKSDGTMSGTVIVKDISLGSGSSDPQFLVEMNNVLYFSGGIGTNNAELWKSDGTQSGTVLLMDINPGDYGSNPSALFNHNGILFFSADDGVHGKELWKYDPNALEISEINYSPDVFVYPNPSSGIFQLTFENMQSSNGELEIYNVSGKKVYSASNINQQMQIDLSNLSKGYYFVKVYSGPKIYNQKIVIQ